MDVTIDLPTNVDTLNPNFELNDPLEMLNTALDDTDFNIHELDDRTRGMQILLPRDDDRELSLLLDDINKNPKQRISSSNVRDLNDRFHKSLDNSNPMFILNGDMRTRTNIELIQRSNKSFAHDRDLYKIAPEKDIQQKILEKLNNI